MEVGGISGRGGRAPLAAWPRIALLAAALVLAFAPAALADVPSVGARAPEVALKSLDGREIDLAKLRGKVVVVNLWATWCAPCRLEMPTLNEFYRAHMGQVELVGLSADRTRDLAKVRQVMSVYSYPAGLLSQARVNRLSDPAALPMTLVIDRAGVVRNIFGVGMPLTRALLEAAVKPLL